MNNKVEVDVLNETFQNKITKFLEDLKEDVTRTKKEVEFHKLIVDLFEKEKLDHEFLPILKESIKEAEKIIEALEKREKESKKLIKFLDGDLVLDFDAFVFLIIDILGRQMVNYVELKNEFERVAKLWVQK